MLARNVVRRILKPQSCERVGRAVNVCNPGKEESNAYHFIYFQLLSAERTKTTKALNNRPRSQLFLM